jgi:hypothetical protein
MVGQRFPPPEPERRPRIGRRALRILTSKRKPRALQQILETAKVDRRPTSKA